MSDVAPSQPLRIDPESKGDNMPASELNSNKGLSKKKSTSAPLRIVDTSVMSVNGLFKSYGKGAVQVPVLKGVDLEIEEGGFTAIIGQRGSGKSTLLHLLGTLDAPDRGEIYFRDQRIDNLPPRQQEYLRNRQFVLTFQFDHLLP